MKSKCVNTPHALTLIVKKLEELAPGDNDRQREILQQSIINGWAGVFEIKPKGGQSGSNRGNTKNGADVAYERRYGSGML